MIKIKSEFISKLQPNVTRWYKEEYETEKLKAQITELMNTSSNTDILNELYENRYHIIEYSKAGMDLFINTLNIKFNYLQIITKEKPNPEELSLREDIAKLCNIIYNYTKFSNKFRVKFIQEANLKSCPYCNSAYILSAGNNKDGSEKLSADLDHFYPKSFYPFFAITLSNLIPVCKFCNQSLKRDNIMKEPHLYPYEEEFGKDANFKYLHNTKSERTSPVPFDPYLKNSDSFEIDININEGSVLEKKIKSHDKIFNIKSIYQFHKNRVARIAELKQIFSEKLPNELAMTFPDLFPSDLSVLKEVEDTYFKHLTQEEEILSKFHKDIIDQINKE